VTAKTPYQRAVIELVMAKLVPAIHVFCVWTSSNQDIDARHKAGHDA